jgi:hypothetical protein
MLLLQLGAVPAALPGAGGAHAAAITAAAAAAPAAWRTCACLGSMSQWILCTYLGIGTSTSSPLATLSLGTWAGGVRGERRRG